MKIKDIIRIFDLKRQNSVSLSEKCRIIDSFERRLNTTLLIPLGLDSVIDEYTEDTEKILGREAIIDNGFEELYLEYLSAECSLYEGDISRYNTDIAEYMRLMREYSQNRQREGKAEINRLTV